MTENALHNNCEVLYTMISYNTVQTKKDSCFYIPKALSEEGLMSLLSKVCA